MDNPTIYRLLEARDSADAAELMRRNGFFFGKLDPQLSTERYDLLQKLKGYLFGVGAEISGKLAAIICVYRAGADRSANSHQVFASALLVDAAYRTRLYSFTEMYRLMLRHLRESMPQVREILLEVYRENLPSLYMQRMFGSVLLDETMPNPEELFIHNYAPAIQRFFPDTPLIDGNEGTVRQLARRLSEKDLLAPDTAEGGVELLSSGGRDAVLQMERLLKSE